MKHTSLSRIVRSSRIATFSRVISPVVALWALTVSATACDNGAHPTPDKQPRTSAQVPTANASASSPSATSSAASNIEAPVSIPTLVAEKANLGTDESLTVFQAGKTMMVATKHRVGAVTGDKIKWIGEIPKLLPAIGTTTIRKVTGTYPDSIDVLYHNDNGRAPMPTFLPLTGGGIEWTAAPGGGHGTIDGPVQIGTGGRTVLLGYSMTDQHTIVTVRGPKRDLSLMSPSAGGCKEGDVSKGDSWTTPKALVPVTIAGTEDGELVVVGRLCGKRGGGAQVWDRHGKAKMVDLRSKVKDLSYGAKLLKGKGHDLWLVGRSKETILHYIGNGKFEPVQRAGLPIKNSFVSPNGELHISDGFTIQKLQGTSWKTVAQLGVSKLPTLFHGIYLADKTFWVNYGGTVQKLKKGADRIVGEDCKTPFVYLYQVSDKNDKNFTFPSTRKALSTFANASDITLVEEAGELRIRYLGIKVKSKTQGEDVIAHVKANMKDEHPRLLCYAPRAARVIKLTP